MCRVKGYQHERALLTLGQHLPSLVGRRIPQTAKGHVAEHSVDRDVGTVGGEGGDYALERAPHRVVGDEREECHGVIERLMRALR